MDSQQANFEQVFSVFSRNFKPIPLERVFDNPFQILVAVMLSARTRDETTVKVCQKLFKTASTQEKISLLSEKELRKLLHPIGFYKTKAKQLKMLAQRLLQDHKGEVPQTLDELTKLPGVGRKTANIVLARAFGIPAIGVDTHVHRIANALAWVKTNTPLQTEKELQKILPKKYWIKTNQSFVSIGQQYRSQQGLKKFLKQNKLV